MTRIIKSYNLFCILILLFIMLAGCNHTPATVTPAPEPTRDLVLESSIERQLEEKNPEAVPLYHEATTAMDSGDFQKSQELYKKVVDMAPDFSTAYRRLGSIQLYYDDVEGAIESMQKAMDIEPNAYNQTALAMALLQRNTPRDSQRAFELASTAVKTLPDDVNTVYVWLLTASALNDFDTARQADEKLLTLDPQNPLGHYVAGLLAASDGKWEDAETELLYSQQLGMPLEGVQATLDDGIATQAMLSRLLRWGIIALAIWLLGFGLLFLAGSILSSKTLQIVGNVQIDVGFKATREESFIRSIYRVLITILSLYFYISIPFVILILLIVVAGGFYIIWEIGHINLYWIAALLVILFGSLYAIACTLFLKSKEVSPGRQLERKEAPELWVLVEHVAQKLNTRPVDAIFMTPGVEIAVFEKGSILKKLQGKGQRNLVLGMGALTGLTQGQFSAILAHEYGHFSNQDTAGGNLAHQVDASLNQLAQQLLQSGAAQIYNPTWLFLAAYHRIYLYVTRGASRLQEILADRFAAIAFGSDNFIDGLKSVVRQSITFPLSIQHELSQCPDIKSIINLYDMPVKPEVIDEAEKEYEKAMKQTTEKYDTHPALRDRISYIKKIGISSSPFENNTQPVLNLFPEPEALQHEITLRVTEKIQKK